ncbi:hypothetical protein K1719_042951 [Acacia pycnantha]|nr:hypothetical protein K1719_042951 [Acacia pycnantha]
MHHCSVSDRSGCMRLVIIAAVLVLMVMGSSSVAKDGEMLVKEMNQEKSVLLGSPSDHHRGSVREDNAHRPAHIQGNA